ncbi:MAG: purine-nucleoside phosphorylase [Clostridia bacterium]|nr:purine-nucleoside phosphorylase [Clostridia bacterium]
MTPHIEAKKGEIAKTVLMPGDPLRAKLIAEKYLENAKLVSSVRNIYAYTGTYKGRELTVMASGMGIPSMGIYSYELYKFYDVENIIRLGSCGGYTKDLKMFDLVLVDNTYTESNYALGINNDNCHYISSSASLNQVIKETANKLSIPFTTANTLCTEAFDRYMVDMNKMLLRLPNEYHITGAEMEAFALFYNAKLLNKNASCLLTVVDSYYYNEEATAIQRQESLDTMIKLGLESAILV